MVATMMTASPDQRQPTYQGKPIRYLAPFACMKPTRDQHTGSLVPNLPNETPYPRRLLVIRSASSSSSESFCCTAHPQLAQHTDAPNFQLPPPKQGASRISYFLDVRMPSLADMANCGKPADYPLEDVGSSWHHGTQEATLQPSNPSIEVSALLLDMSHHHMPL